MNTTTALLEQRLNSDTGLHQAPILENHPTQSATAIDGWRSAVFGVPFLAAGVWTTLAALGFVSGRKHAPDCVIPTFRPLFFFLAPFFPIPALPSPFPHSQS